MRAVFFLFIGLTLLVACTKNMRINIPPDNVMPVMTTMIAKDSTITVDLSYSKPVLEPANDYPSIKDANVNLYINDAFVETLTGKETGRFFQYISKYRPVQGEKIRIDARINDQLVKGETVIPSKPDIVGGNAFQAIEDGFNNMIYKISFSINDRANTNDCYQLRIFQVNNGAIDRKNPISFIIENIKTREGGIFDDFITQDQSSSHYFDDYSFDGKTFVVNIKSTYHANLDGIAIELSAISKEAYLYFKSIQLQDLRNDDPIYEKVSLFSNIINGLGIVGSINRSVMIQEVER